LSIPDAYEAAVWSRPALSSRTRCLITLGVTTALYQPGELEGVVRHALDAGLSPDEIHEALFHAGLYRGMPAWRCATTAANIVFAERGLLELPETEPFVPRGPQTHEERVAARNRVAKELRNWRMGTGDAAPPLPPLGTASPPRPPRLPIEKEILELMSLYSLGDVWSRSGLSLEERSLITVSVLTAINQPGRLYAYINTARNVGLTEEQILEALLHAGVYGGVSSWRAAVKVARSVFDARSRA
jgi:4-carboxymuconolactone decarboxylase